MYLAGPTNSLNQKESHLNKNNSLVTKFLSNILWTGKVKMNG